MIRARKTSRYGSTYTCSRTGARATFWRCGRGYMVRAFCNWTQARPIYSFWKTREDAVDEVGRYVDPEQCGRYIVDNEPYRIAA